MTEKDLPNHLMRTLQLPENSHHHHHHHCHCQSQHAQERSVKTMKLYGLAALTIPLFLVRPVDADCADTKLVKTASGPDSSCSGYADKEDRFHMWPVSTDTTYCHGWRGTAAQNNEVHDNSANNIRCSTSDGKTRLLYTQFAASLDCSGTGVDKEYVLDECHQGTPPSLYDMGLNMDCCTDPEGASCTGTYTGQASVAESQILTDISIYGDGVQCSGGNSTGGTDTTSSAYSTEVFVVSSLSALLLVLAL